MNRVFIISYFYPPVSHPRSLRVREIASYLASQGYEISILTPWVPGSRFFEKSDGVNIYRFGVSLRSFFLSHERLGSNKPKRIAKFHRLFELLKKFWRAFYWPDYACIWIIPALLFGLVIYLRQRPKYLISISWPFSSHVVGLLLKKFVDFKSWIIDMGDSFANGDYLYVNNKEIYEKANRSLEKIVFANATKILLPNSNIVELHRKAYPSLSSKIEESAHLALDPGRKKIAAITSATLTFIYAGNINLANASPLPFLRLLAEYADARSEKQIQMIFLGRNENALPEKLHDYIRPNLDIRRVGFVSRDKALAYLESADFAVNISGLSNLALPSKVVEYVASGLPVITFAKDETDLSIRYLKDYRRHLVVFDGSSDRDEDFRQLDEFIQDRRRVPVEVREKILLPNKIESVCRPYLQTFNTAG